MRRVRAWLVTEYTDLVDTVVEMPVRAFTDRGLAERCACVRDARAEGYEDHVWNEVREIEVVLDDAD